MNTSLFQTAIPTGLSLSKKSQALAKKADEALTAYREFTRTNADCEPQKRQNGTTQVPALVRADRDLREAEIQAVRDGKPMPDADKWMAEARNRVADYERRKPALSAAHHAARVEFEQAVKDELEALAKAEIASAAKATEEILQAQNVLYRAKAAQEASASRAVWCLTSGALTRPIGTGFGDPGAPTHFNVTKDGKLSHESAQALGLRTVAYGDMVEIPELVEDAPEPETTQFHLGRPVSRGSVTATGF